METNLQEVARTMTETLFMSIFLLGLGYLIGKLFIGLNPFLMIFGMFILLGMSPALVELNSNYYTVCFVFGGILNFKRPISYVLSLLRDFIGSINFRPVRYAGNIHEQKRQAEDELLRQKHHVEEELKRQKYEAEQDILRQRREAEEAIKREAENFRREKKAYEESKKNSERDKSQSSSYGNKKRYLNPLIFSDACEILGVPQGKTLREYKRAYLKKMKVYHADKLAGLSDELRQQEEEKVKVLNVAMDTIRKKFS